MKNPVIQKIEKIVNLKLKNISLEEFIDFRPLPNSYSVDARGEVVKLCITASFKNNFDFSFFSELKFLRVLWMSACDLNEIDFLSNQKLLEILYLDNNKITNIDPLSELVNLKQLGLWVNSISDISPLQYLEKLELLNLGGNSLTEIESISDLKGLKSLYLWQNYSIKDFRPLAKLKEIQSLYLMSCGLKKVDFLSDTTSLRNLNISSNLIDNLDSLYKLKKIKELDASYNEINSIRGIETLVDIRILDLKKNFILDISILENLTNLEYLDLNHNTITELSPLNNLKKLKNLNIEDNAIQTLLPIKDLLKLLSENSRSSLNAGNNPLQMPPIQTVSRGVSAVLRYFDKIENEGQAFIYESKVTLVGEGSAGKTSLQRRLINPKAILPKEDKRTRGIEVIDWEFKKANGKIHIAHIWDFGGQDVYYPVHRFFLTENSVFVLLASSRQNIHNFEYWIPTIFQFGGKSPILLVQTCHDGNQTPWNDLGTYVANENFNIIKNTGSIYHEVNLKGKKNIGLVQIKKAIINQILNLPHYKKNVPKSWISVRNLITGLKESNCISYIELKKKITELNPESFSSKDDIEDCLKFFHDIGIILWYYKEDNLKDWVILNPGWSVEAVYKIIDDEKILNQKGIILKVDFERVWRDKKYDDKHTILKDMLAVFKIAFPKKHNTSDFIIPARLISIPRENIWNDNVSDLHLEYRYEFMPKGIVNQISAELSRYIVSDEQVWNNGVNLSFENSESQIFEDFYNRRITIKAKGKDSRGIVMTIMNATKNITDEYKGVQPKIIIPCPCVTCKSQSDSEIFIYDNLLKKLEKNKDAKVMCNISDEVFEIEKLLYANGLPNPIKINEIKKIFISYSKQDDKYKKEFVKHLITLKDENLIDPFNCDEIDLGDNSHDVIQQKLNECDYMIALVSVDFLNTDYIRTFEVDKAIELGKKIIPIIIKPCDWENSKLGKFHASLRGTNISLNSKLFLEDEIKETTEIERQANWVKIIKEFRTKLLLQK